MKLNALTDARHSDEEIERRLAEIDENIRKAKDIFVQQSHLPGPAPSVTAVTRLPVLRRHHPPRLRHPHRADGLHGAGGGTGVRGGSSPLGDACL